MLHEFSSQEVLNLLPVNLTEVDLLSYPSSGQNDVVPVDFSPYRRVVFYVTGAYGRLSKASDFTSFVNLPPGIRMDLLLRGGGSLYFCSADQSKGSTLWVWGFR